MSFGCEVGSHYFESVATLFSHLSPFDSPSPFHFRSSVDEGLAVACVVHHHHRQTLHQHATNPNTTLPSSADGRVGMVGDVERVLVEIGCRGMLLLVVRSLGTVGAAVSGWFAAVVVGLSVLVSFGVGISRV
ncbi:hypothetical protein GQ457_08G024310 [Hibiscus cannabinus]